MSTNAPNTPAPSHLRLRRSTSGIAADRAYFAATAVACAVGVAAIAYFIWALVAQTTDVWSTFGVWGFLTGTEWVPTPASGPPKFGALPFIYGTLVTSIIAVTIALPLAIGVGLATTTFLPRRLRRPVAAVVDLLAAVPSVVFALWGFTAASRKSARRNITAHAMNV